MRRIPVAYAGFGLLASVLMNLPALFASDVGLRIGLTGLTLVALGLLGLFLVRRSRSSQGVPVSRAFRGPLLSGSSVVGTASGVAWSSTLPVDGVAIMRSIHRTHTVMRWWFALVGVGLLAGSLAGALVGPWAAQVVGGALGFSVVEAILRSYALGRFRRLSAMAGS